MHSASPSCHSAAIQIDMNGEGSLKIVSLGSWTVGLLGKQREQLSQIAYQKEIHRELAAINDIDVVGMVMFIYYEILIAQQCKVTLSGASDKFNRLQSLCRQYYVSRVSSSQAASFLWQCLMPLLLIAAEGYSSRSAFINAFSVMFNNVCHPDGWFTKLFNAVCICVLFSVKLSIVSAPFVLVKNIG